MWICQQVRKKKGKMENKPDMKSTDMLQKPEITSYQNCGVVVYLAGPKQLLLLVLSQHSSIPTFDTESRNLSTQQCPTKQTFACRWPMAHFGDPLVSFICFGISHMLHVF